MIQVAKVFCVHALNNLGLGGPGFRGEGFGHGENIVDAGYSRSRLFIMCIVLGSRLTFSVIRVRSLGSVLQSLSYTVCLCFGIGTSMISTRIFRHNG